MGLEESCGRMGISGLEYHEKNMDDLDRFLRKIYQRYMWCGLWNIVICIKYVSCESSKESSSPMVKSSK